MPTIYSLFPDLSFRIVEHRTQCPDNLFLKGIDGFEGEVGGENS
jgi:hypothetical protein